MKRLMSEGKYFSVGEMRKRNPLLFDQLLGGFLKNPEIKLDDIQEHQLVLIVFLIENCLCIFQCMSVYK